MSPLFTFTFTSSRFHTANERRDPWWSWHQVANSSTSSKKFIGGSPLQKELQGVAAFVAYAEIHRRGDSISQAMQHSMIGEKYFWNQVTPILSAWRAEHLVMGLGVLHGLYSTLFSGEKALAYTQGAVTSSNADNTVLRFKPELHCLGPLTRITNAGNQDGISLPLLLQKGDLAGDEKIASCTLLCIQQSKEVYNKELQEVSSHVMDDLSPYKNFLKLAISHQVCNLMTFSYVCARECGMMDRQATLLSMIPMTSRISRWWQM